MTLNQWVPGSSPGGCTENPVSSHESWIFFILWAFPHRNRIANFSHDPFIRDESEHVILFRDVKLQRIRGQF
jgi:hypothetical protein